MFLLRQQLRSTRGGWALWCVWLAGLWAYCVSTESLSWADELHAEKILAWEFQRSEDRNNDQWPDGWRRRTGREFPAYIPARIQPRDPEIAQSVREAEPVLSRLWMKYQTGRYFKQFIPESTPEPIAKFSDQFLVNKCLNIDMDGGAVHLESPAFLLDSRFTYTLEGSISTRGLDGHQAWIELLLLDGQSREIASAQSQVAQGTTGWHSVTTSSLSSEALRMGQVVVHVAPQKSQRLTGQVRIDELRLYRMPKLELTVDAPYHVATPGQVIDVSCHVLGIADARSSVNFKLVDHMGTLCQHAVAALEPVEPNPPASVANRTGSNDSDQAKPRPGKLTIKSVPNIKQNGIKPQADRADLRTEVDAANHRMDGVAHWQLKVDDPGYYRIIVDLGRKTATSEGRSISRETSLAIVDGSRAGVSGPFGWSMPEFNASFTPEAVPELIKLGGVGWLKIPVWFNPRDLQTAERLSVLLERLDLRKVNCVGMLERPIDSGTSRTRQPAAATFSTPAEWEPELEPALTRMSMKLAWFQLGRDNDRSFIGNPNLIPLVTDIRNRMQAYSQELQLALAWDHQDPIPTDKSLPWRASQMSSEPQLTSRELRSHLLIPDSAEHTRWITLNPLAASKYSTLDRVRDLTERMIAIKEFRVEAAFMTTPIDRETGIFNPDNSVGELFLPWRVLNQNLATASYLGAFTMPGSSTNHVFREGNSGCIILWNDRPTVEQLYLGDDVQATDLWGRPLPIEQTKSERGSPEQRLQVGPWPILLRGINVNVALWRMRLKMETKSLPSTLAVQTKLPITIENTLGQSTFGSVYVHAPTLKQMGGQGVRFQISEGGEERLEIPLPLKSDASAGKHLLRFDFQATAQRELNFSAYDSLTLGIGDIDLVWETIEVDNDRAVLRVELNNSLTQPVSFDCRLHPHQRPYRRFQIMDAPPGTTQRDLVLPLEGVEPGSILWIRCEEIGTGRVLNYRLPLKVGE